MSGPCRSQGLLTPTSSSSCPALGPPNPHDSHRPHMLCLPRCPASTCPLPCMDQPRGHCSLQGSPLTPVRPFKPHLPGATGPSWPQPPTPNSPYPFPLSFSPCHPSPSGYFCHLVSASPLPTGAPGDQESVSVPPTAPTPPRTCRPRPQCLTKMRSKRVQSQESCIKCKSGVFSTFPPAPRSGAALLVGPGPRAPEPFSQGG